METKKSLWTEKFNPQPAREMKINSPVIGLDVWNWTFEKGPDGKYVRAGLVLILIRQKAIELSRRGVKGNLTLMAHLDIYERYGHA